MVILSAFINVVAFAIFGCAHCLQASALKLRALLVKARCARILLWLVSSKAGICLKG